MNISYLYLPHLPGRGEQCNGEHDRQTLYPRTSTTLVTENLLFCQKCGNIYQISCLATFGVFLVVLLFTWIRRPVSWFWIWAPVSWTLGAEGLLLCGFLFQVINQMVIIHFYSKKYIIQASSPLQAPPLLHPSPFHPWCSRGAGSMGLHYSCKSWYLQSLLNISLCFLFGLCLFDSDWEESVVWWVFDALFGKVNAHFLPSVSQFAETSHL